MDHRDAARFVADRLKAEMGDEVERVVLYGSVARGEATRTSDVDLVAVAEDKTGVRDALGPVLGELMRRGAPVVSVMVFTPDQYDRFDRRHLPFYRDVLQGETLVA